MRELRSGLNGMFELFFSPGKMRWQKKASSESRKWRPNNYKIKTKIIAYENGKEMHPRVFREEY